MRQLNCLAQFWNGETKIALLRVRQTEDQMRQFVGWIHFKSVAKLLDGSVVLSRHIEPPSQAEIDADGERIKFSGFVDLLEAVLRTTHRHQVKGISLVGGGIAGVILNRFREARRGATPIPIVVKLDRGE